MAARIILIFLLLFTIPCAPRPILAAFGDSITAGTYSGGAAPYAAIVAADLGFTLDNRAVSGTLVAQMLDQIRAYDGPAHDVIWLVCANDLTGRTPAADFAARVQLGVDLLRLKGMRVYLNADCPPFQRADDAALVAAYNQALGAIVRRHPVDVAAFPLESFRDGTHPNADGHLWLAARYEEALRRRVWLP